jgi:spore coat polysaccharide biosynthesis protein SpsF
MNTVIIVQARTGSSRLPNKVLLPVVGQPLLRRMLERVMAASTASAVVVATTTDPGDAPIVELCRSIDLPCFTGHPTDLLDRYYQAARPYRPDIVVKIPSDCPLIDPGIIDRVLTFYHDHQQDVDFVSNLHPATYPDGNDVEVIPFHVLETAWRNAWRNFEREHTTPFIWERPKRFRIGNVEWETGLNYSMTHRWTIDYPEDYLFIRSVYEQLSPDGSTLFTLNDILDLLAARPDIHRINARYAGINWYRHHLDDLTTISATNTRTEESLHQT